MLRLDYEALADSSRTLIEQGDMIQEMAEQMQKISDNFREADADMAGQM